MRCFASVLTFSLTVFGVSAQGFESATISAPNFVRVGEPIPYTISLTTGPAPTQPPTTITNFLPATTALVNGSLTCTSGWYTYTVSSHVVTWSGALSSSDSMTLSYSVDSTEVAGGTYLINEATAKLGPLPAQSMTRTTCVIGPGQEPVIGEPFGFAIPDGTYWPWAPAAITWNSNRETFMAAWVINSMSIDGTVMLRTIDLDRTLGTSTSVTSVLYTAHSPALACSPASSRCLVAYSRTVGTSPTDNDIWARFVDDDGTPVGSEFPIYQGTGNQTDPSVVFNSSLDEFLIVWENSFSDGRWDIQAQRIRASDGVFESWSNIATGAGEQRYSCGVAHNPARDQYLFVYLYGLVGNEGRGKIGPGNLAGVSSGTEMTIWSTPEVSNHVSVAAGDDEFLAVWRASASSSGDQTIRGRRIGGDGTVSGPGHGFFIGGFGSQAMLFDPKVGNAGGGDYLVTWGHDDPSTPTTEDIHGRYIESGTDEAAYSEFPVVASVDFDYSGTFACAPTGQCLLANQRVNTIFGRFLVDWRIFADGFEGGNLAAWSTSSLK